MAQQHEQKRQRALVVGSSGSCAAAKDGWDALPKLVVELLKNAGFETRNETDSEDLAARLATESDQGELSVLVVCTLEASREPRLELAAGLTAVDDQIGRLIEGETRRTMRVVYACMSRLLRAARPPYQPSTVVLLGSKMVRSPNSPSQIIASAAKRALAGFAGSLFFERRGAGLRVTSVHPGPLGEGIGPADLAQALVFPLSLGPHACVESVDLVAISRAPASRAGGRRLAKGAVVVTGGSRGIGAAVAERLAREFGFRVTLLGRDEAALAESARKCAVHVGSDAVAATCVDLRDNVRLRAAIDGAAMRWGGLTSIVCSAGINRRRNAASKDGKSFADPVVWQDVVNSNLNSAMAATGYAVPHLVATSTEGLSPAIFFVGSRNVRIGGAIGQQAYLASKAGINAFAQSVQQELKPLGIKVVVLNVGLVATDLGTRTPTNQAFKPVSGDLQIQPSDVGEACVYAFRCAPHVSPAAIDICGTSEEFLGAGGEALKASSL